MPGTPLQLLVGLGNPGPQYARTRHNAGFMWADEIGRLHGGTFRNEPRHGGELARVSIAGVSLWLLKPMGFMNESGGPVRSVASFYRIPVEAILVAHDELDFPPGVVRLRHGGGAAGHNGLRDLIAQLGADFWRLRIGIGHPGDKDAVLGHVLGRLSAGEEQPIAAGVAAAAAVVPVLLEQGTAKAMQALHTRS